MNIINRDIINLNDFSRSNLWNQSNISISIISWSDHPLFCLYENNCLRSEVKKGLRYLLVMFTQTIEKWTEKIAWKFDELVDIDSMIQKHFASIRRMGFLLQIIIFRAVFESRCTHNVILVDFRLTRI
jgi:hypothetical protein